MNSDRWQRVQDLFHRALDREPADRERFLVEACGHDTELADEVRALIAVDAADHSPISGGVGAMAHAVFEGGGKVPERIGPYRVLELLGEGGMGVVYKARRDDLDTVVAIKLLRDARLSPHRRERFRREQRMLGKLSHPSICALYDAGVLDDGTPYFVMEYVDGLPLTRFCEQYALSLEARLHLLREVAEAVGHAHRRMLIHRDLKPSNILATRPREDAPARIKLLDFGIAKQREDAEEHASATRTMFRLLTPAYAAPEQIVGAPPGTFTDVYSMGVVLYELLTGELPFDGAPDGRAPERPSSRVRRSDRAPAFVATVRPRDWADLDVMCLKAMHGDPERRYRTVDALVTDIDRYLSREPLEARPDSVGYRLHKFMVRNRRPVVLAAVVAVAFAAVLTFYTLRLQRARDAALEEMARTQRIQQFTLSLFQGGDEVAGPRKGLEVLTLIERGVREAEALDDRPQIQAELFHQLGGVFHQLGEFDRAAELTHRALDLRTEFLGDDHPDTIVSMTALGDIEADRGELGPAERHVRTALDRAERRLGERDPRTSAAIEALGSILTRLGRYDEAFEVLNRAIALRERAGDEVALRESLGSLADAHFYAGDYEASDTINRRLLERIEATLGADHPTYATCLNNLAASRKWLGYPEEAEALYRQALEINRAYHGESHPVVASNLSLLGSTMADEGELDEAREMLDRALAITEEIHGPDHPETGLVLDKLARVALGRGDLAEAAALYTRELSIYRATYGDGHVRTAVGWSNLATIRFRQGRLDEAETSMRRAVAVFAAALKPDHIDLATARVKLGQLLVAAGRHRDAVEPLTGALEVLEAQSNPQSAWIAAAREGLAEARSALGD